MTSLFLYGTLRHVPLLTCVLGRVPEALVPCDLPDHRVAAVEGQDFPMIVPASGETARGLLLRDVSEADLARIDYYEGGFDYALEPCIVQTPDGPAEARVYRSEGDWTARDDDWSFDDWVAAHGALTELNAADVMRQFGRTPVAQIRAFAGFHKARGWSRLLARNAAPATLRSDRDPSDVSIEDSGPGFDGFFRMREMNVRYRRFDGAMSGTMQRECFVGYDAALVVPYDPVNDRILLIEQLRLGVANRGDPHPWVLEPVAGMVDAGETPETCVMREAQEEAGLTLDALEFVSGVYASPGYTTDFFHCYVGLCTLPEPTSWLGGLASENEDIRSHVIPFERADALLASGEINVAPLAMILLWLARHRARLRAAA